MEEGGGGREGEEITPVSVEMAEREAEMMGSNLAGSKCPHPWGAVRRVFILLTASVASKADVSNSFHV